MEFQLELLDIIIAAMNNKADSSYIFQNYTSQTFYTNYINQKRSHLVIYIKTNKNLVIFILYYNNIF